MRIYDANRTKLILVRLPLFLGALVSGYFAFSELFSIWDWKTGAINPKGVSLFAVYSLVTVVLIFVLRRLVHNDRK